jgi:7-carboxy-7-deazaguanine synthase
MSDYEYQLKFVIAEPGDLEELRSICKAIGAARDRVLLMPEGTTPEVLRERAAWLVDVCTKEGFRFSPRLHIELWGNRRGV